MEPKTSFALPRPRSPVVRLLACALCTLALLGSSTARAAQFVNGSFELGWQGWTLEYAEFNGAFNPNTAPWQSTPPTGHPGAAIVDATSPAFGGVTLDIDPYCGLQMARMQDLGGDRHATRVSQSIVLGPEDIHPTCPDAQYVRVTWGALLVDPANQHGHDEYPLFRFRVLLNGAVVNEFESDGDQAGQSGSGWIPAGNSGGPVWYRTATTELALPGAQPNDTVRVELIAADCGLGGHGAAAYLDCVEFFQPCSDPCTNPSINELMVFPFVPNAFTPNNDDLNDLWNIRGIYGATYARVRVWNRWGNVVVDVAHCWPEGKPTEKLEVWDGVYNGQPAEVGVYVWHVEVANCVDRHERVGVVLVLR